MGLLTGDWLLALPLGITLELLWLDVVPLGSVVPPQGVLSFMLMFPLARLYGWSAPGALLLPLLLAVFAAYAAAFAERSQRVLLNRIMPAVEGYCRTGHGCAPGHALLLGISLRACWQFALYLGARSVIFRFWPYIYERLAHRFSHKSAICNGTGSDSGNDIHILELLIYDIYKGFIDDLACSRI